MSLVLLQMLHEMVMPMIGVVILTLVSWVINRALGVPMPVWSTKEQENS